MKKFVLILVLSLSLLLISCNAHNLVANMEPFGTPIPTVAIVTPPPLGGSSLSYADRCQITAVDLLTAWANANYPKEDSFDFDAIDGTTCSGNFDDDVLPLFTQSNLWYSGAVPCAACHGPDLEVSYAQMDLSSYDGIMAGSRRLGETKPVVGDAWEQTKLYEVLMTTRFMPMGRPADMPDYGPVVPAGMAK